MSMKRVICPAILSLSIISMSAFGQAQESDVSQAVVPNSLDREAISRELQELNLSLTPEQRTKLAEQRIKLLESSDEDKDGYITEAELTATLQEQFSRLDRNQNGEISLNDAPRFWMRQRYISAVGAMIEQYDSDGSESLSFAEFSTEPLKRLKVLGGDGNLDAMILQIEAQASGREG